MREKILYLHASAELYGADYVLLELVTRLNKSKYEPIVLLPFRGPLYEKMLGLGVDVRILDFAVLRRQYFTPKGIIEFAYRLFVSTWKILQLVRKERVAIIHTNTIAVFGGAFAAKLAGKPHVWQVMEIIVSPKALWKVSSWIVGAFSDRIAAISNAARDHLVLGYAGVAAKVKTVYHGVDSAVYHPLIDPAPIKKEFGLADGVPVIGMAARISPWKGQDCFLRAAAQVLQQFPKARFFVVGDVFPGNEKHRDEMMALIDELGIRDSVITPGFRSDLPQVMAAFDVFVLPSTLPEPNATVLLAAMGMGKPVIATATGGTLETVIDRETGILVSPGQPDYMANAIVELLQDPQKRKQYGDAGKVRQESVFSIAAYASQIQDFYRAILLEKEKSK